MRKLTKKQQHWQDLIEGWRQSGLSQVEYCRKSKIDVKNFYRWKAILRKFQNQDQENKPASDIDAPHFVELALKPTENLIPNKSVTITINNAAIMLTPDTDFELASRAVRLLREAS